MHSKRFSPLIAALFACLCCACGQTGPLYLPESAAPEAATPSDARDPATDRKDRAGRRGTDAAPASDTETPATPADPDRPQQTPQSPR
jgi:hypothetical protein